MNTLLLLVRVTLASIFVIAGVAKLADRSGSRKALLDFGLPRAFAPALALLLPSAELAVGLSLVPVATEWWGALGALLLLFGFLIAISINLAWGRKPNCHCFGQLHSKPIGWPTLARNGLLAVFAGLIVWHHPGPSFITWITGISGNQVIALTLAIVAFAAIATEGWLLLHLLRQNGRLLLTMEMLEKRIAAASAGQIIASESDGGLPIGALAPDFELPTVPANAIVSLNMLLAKRNPVLLIFTDPGCAPCNDLMPDISQWQRAYSDSLTVGIISRGTQKIVQAKAAEHGLTSILLQHANEVAEAYQCYSTPGAVLIRHDGTIDSAVKIGRSAIVELVMLSAEDGERSVEKKSPVKGSLNSAGDKSILRPSLQIGDLNPT